MKQIKINDIKSLAHTAWNCKYHIVFAPKYRRKVFYQNKRLEIGAILRQLCEWKGITIIESEVCSDHIHMLIEIPPKYSVLTLSSMADVKNKVYYNCVDTDINGVSHGENNYDYASSCEVWRIIGVFNTKSSTSSDAVPRVKLINIASTFKASWDSSASSGDNAANGGYGINQWGPSGNYLGTDLMQLLNGYYIGKENSTCTYCDGSGQETCANTCDTESAILASQNMKPLTAKAKSMIENAVWDTYGVKWPGNIGLIPSSWAPTAYLEEKGISAQNTGKNLCVDTNGSDYSSCNDSVERTTSWTGLVGLMSVADLTYAEGWLYDEVNYLYAFSITPYFYEKSAYSVWFDGGGYTGQSSAYTKGGVWPSVYLNSDIQIIGGNGDTEPYKFAVLN